MADHRLLLSWKLQQRHMDAKLNGKLGIMGTEKKKGREGCNGAKVANIG
jgi:hypothetical protein